MNSKVSGFQVSWFGPQEFEMHVEAYKFRFGPQEIEMDEAIASTAGA